MTTPSRMAIVVGIDNYPGSPLSCCVNDATEITAALQMPEFGFQVTKLIDSEAKRSKIFAAITAATHQSPEKLVIYFAGHGCVTDLGAFLVTVDAEPYSEGVDFNQLKNMLAHPELRDTEITIMLDCCHSGMANVVSPRDRIITRSDIEQSAGWLGSSRVILAACRASEYAGEDATAGHGLFTSKLLEGLLGGAVDYEGNITANALYDYVAKPFEAEIGQLPVFRGDLAGRVVLARGFAPRKGAPIEAEQLKRLEEFARQKLDEFQYSQAAGYEDRKKTGYKHACQRLEPILSWFGRKIEEYPQLQARKPFMEMHGAAIARLAQLGAIDPGTVIEEGVIDEKLGEGAFGSVWKIVNQDGSPVLAYKVYHPHELGISEKTQRFERGYYAMKQLDHPHIVKVRGLTRVPLGFFMDFVDGPNLRNLSSEAFSSPQDAVRLLLLIAETLQHAHGREVVHRDVKPENIIMSYDASSSGWRAFLTDFDLSWFSTATALTKEALGTIFYAAPEQINSPQSSGAHAPTVDIYAFGQLAYFLVTGSDPLPQMASNNIRNLEKRLEAWGGEQPAREFRELYKQCTEYKADLRPATMRTVADRLRSIENGLRNPDPDALMAQERLIAEVVFSLAGFGDNSELNETSFTTLSGRTRVSLLVTGAYDLGRLPMIDIEVHFRVQQTFLIEGMANEKARNIINDRIGEELKAYSFARRRAGSHGSYEVYVDMSRILRKFASVRQVSEAIARVIDVLERSR